MLIFKDGVSIFGLQPESLWAIDRCNDAFDAHGLDCVITSGRGDAHGRASLHFAGHAFDCRTRHVRSQETLREIILQIKEALGRDYDVVFESDHLHVEYQPKAADKYPRRHPYVH